MDKKYYVVENDTITNCIIMDDENLIIKNVICEDKIDYFVDIGYVKNESGIFSNPNQNNSIAVDEITDEMIEELLKKL